jgi:hypothetical protein
MRRPHSLPRDNRPRPWDGCMRTVVELERRRHVDKNGADLTWVYVTLSDCGHRIPAGTSANAHVGAGVICTRCAWGDR